MNTSGTIVNTAAVIAGSMIGLLLKSRFPKRLEQPLFNAIGAFTVFLGIRMAFETANMLILVISIVSGTLAGELLNIDKGISKFSELLKKRFRVSESQFTKGLVTGFLLFCMGSMTVLGAFEEGLGNTPHLFYTKSVMDGFSSIVLSSTLGIGVIFSAIPLFIYQSLLTISAGILSPVLTQAVIAEISAAGGLMLICLGISIADIKEIKVINMIPALVIAGILAFFIL